MKQEPSQELQKLRQTLQEELRQIGGLPLKHDTFFCAVFKIEEFAKGFLRQVLSERILSKIKLNGLTVEPGDFLNQIFRETRADVIYRIPLLGSEESLRIFILLEHKSYNEFFAVFQANQYAGQIGQEEIRIADKEKRFNSKFRLSPVLVILFYHGEEPFTGAKDTSEVYVQGILDDEYLMHQKAVVFNVTSLSKEQILDDPEVPELYPILRLMQNIHSSNIAKVFREVIKRFKPYLTLPKYRYLFRLSWFYFMGYAEKITSQDFESITETVKENLGEQEMSTMYEQISAKGKAEGEAKSILKILSRLDTVSDSLSERVYAITDIDELDRLTGIALDTVLIGGSLEEFVKHLPD